MTGLKKTIWAYFWPCLFACMLAYGALIVSRSLHQASPFPVLDRRSLIIGAILLMYFAPIIFIAQLFITWLVRKWVSAPRRRTAGIFMPAMLITLGVIASAFLDSRPSRCFRRMLSEDPPASVSDIRYRNVPGFDYIEQHLTFCVAPEDLRGMIEKRKWSWSPEQNEYHYFDGTVGSDVRIISRGDRWLVEWRESMD